MINIVRGFRGKLEDSIQVVQPFQVHMETMGNAEYDTCCFGVDANNKLSDDRYMIFYNQLRSPDGEIICNGSGNFSDYTVNLSAMPANIQKLVFTVSIDGAGTMGQIRSHKVQILQNGAVCMELNLTGKDFQNEKAIIGVEIYMKSVWRISAPASGYNGGLADLLKHYGGTLAEPAPAPQPAPIPQPAPPPHPAPTPQPAPAPKQATKVELRKGQKVSLEKKGGQSLGQIHVNLNWSQPTGFASIFSGGIDLDLECLYELTDGTRGCIQALGKKFGSLTAPPYIQLDGDDRSGASADGENIHINGDKLPQIKRMLIFTSIYEGTANWATAKGVVTIKCPNNPELVVRMDDYNSNCKVCAIALLENKQNEGFTVEKIVQYFDSKPKMDEKYHWGLTWGYGRK